MDAEATAGEPLVVPDEGEAAASVGPVWVPAELTTPWEKLPGLTGTSVQRGCF